MPPPVFLDDTAFQGEFQPRRANAETGGKAIYRGRVIFTNLDRAVVDEVIPHGLTLASNVSSSPDVHPIVLMYGVPSHGEWIIKGQEIKLRTRYHELMLLVPFVCHTGNDRWHTFPVRIYLDDTMARDIGNIHFGYAKRLASFSRAGTVHSTTVAGQPVFKGDFRRIGPWMPDAQADTDLPNYATVKKIFEMPVVGRHSLGYFVCSYFEWLAADARVARLESSHQFLQPFTSTMVSWTGLGTLNNVPDGAFAISNLEWRIKFPPIFPCEF